jgi:hypothetical protein
MGILNIKVSQAGLVGTLPTPIYINTNDTYATVTATGYLNGAHQLGQAFSAEQMALVYTSDEGPVWLKVTISGTDYSLEQISSPGDVTLPTIANNIIVSSDTAGTLANTTATAVNRGSIQAGLDADAGTLISYPATTASGTLNVAAVDSSADVAVTISNADHAQASVVSIPDGGQATAEFIISDSAGTQNITSGGLQVDAGIVSSGLAAGGFVGEFDAYPTTTASGILSLVAADNASGDFDTTISNATAVGQDQVISIPDAGAATSEFILTAAAAGQTIETGLQVLGNVQTTNGDNFLAGSDANAGSFFSFPTTTASGSLALAAVDSSADVTVTISNADHGQATVVSIPDGGAATASFDISPSDAVAIAPKAIVRSITAGFAALGTAGTVTVQAAPSVSSQFIIVDVKVMYGAAGLSGGGGDRLLSLTDGTIAFNASGITAALLGTPIYTVWGGTGNPVPGSVSTTSTAGADIVLQYAGGSTDFTAGDVTIQVTLAQVTL